MPAGDNPHSISEKKAALRESPKQSKNAAVNQQARASPFLKDKAAEIVGTKRPQPHGPLSPGPNGHLVYVRRKLDSEQSKGSASSGAESTASLSSKKHVVVGGGGPQEQSLKHQNSAPHTQSAPVSATPAAAASVPALHSASLLAHLSFAKQGASAGAESTTSPSPKKPVIGGGPQEQSLKRQNSVPRTQSAPVSAASPATAASVPGLHSATLPAHLSLVKESPGKVPAHQNSVPHTQSAPVSTPPAAASSVAGLHSASLPAHLSLVQKSPGKVTAHQSVAPTAASPPQRSVASTASPQRFTAANTAATPPQRNILSTAMMPQNFTAAKTASPPHRNIVSTAIPQNFTAASPPKVHHAHQSVSSTASPSHRSVMPQNFAAAHAASPTHRSLASPAAPQSFTAASMAPCVVAAASASPRDAVATTTTTARSPAKLQRPGNQDWKERFIRLQAFLRNEQSGQEEYIRMLQSLSSVGRSKHAVELEKRAVNLLIEEGKELQKMKSLNVLGKLPPADHPSLPTQPTFAMRLPFQPFPARR